VVGPVVAVAVIAVGSGVASAIVLVAALDAACDTGELLADTVVEVLAQARWGRLPSEVASGVVPVLLPAVGGRFGGEAVQAVVFIQACIAAVGVFTDLVEVA